MSEMLQDLRDLLAGPGGQQYLGEQVSVAAHLLQAAGLARAAGAADHLVVAALLHDVGHILPPVPGETPGPDADDRHDARGADWLARWFGPEVTEPVRLHVAAKRYLCTVDPHYVAVLSEASAQSLRLQGGTMSPAEIAGFESAAHHGAAVAVRRWDDEAKDPDWPAPDFSEFTAALRAAASGA